MRAHLLTFLIVAVLSAGAEDTRLCTRRGIQCSDCYTLSNCVEDADALGFHYENDRKCSDRVCDEWFLYCRLDGYCRYKEFECPRKDYEDEEVFPDPFYCVKYHGCQGPEKYDYICEPGSAFNPATKSCSLKLDDKICIEYPVPLCETENQSGIIENSDYVYNCVKEVGPPPRIYPIVELRNSTA